MPSYLTLAEYSQFLEKDGKLISSGVVDILRKDAMILEKMKFVNINSMKAKANRVKTLPSLQNRNLNAAYSHSVGSIEPVEENLYLFGGRVDFDWQLQGGDDMIADPAAWNVKQYARALAYGWNSDFVNNTPSANPKSIVGLRYRMLNDFSGQIVDGGGVDISSDAASLSANQNTFLDAIDSAIYKCDEHTCDVILTNETTRLRMISALRQQKLYATTKDAFGRTVTTYGEGGPMILDIGYKADQTTKIMTDDEGATGLQGGGTKTSLFFLKFGDEYLTGVQKKSGLTSFEWQTGVLKHVELDWAAGIFITNPRSVSWLYNVQAI